MKKLISLVLAAIMIFSICSCGATTGEQGTSKNQKEVEYAAAEIAYTELVKAEDLSVSIMDSIYGAWYFSIYKYDDDYVDGLSGVMAFSDATDIEVSELMDVIKEYVGSDIWYKEAWEMLENLSFSMYVVNRAWENRGEYEKINEHLNLAKESLKTLTNEHSDYTGYSVLKSTIF